MHDISKNFVFIYFMYVKYKCLIISLTQYLQLYIYYILYSQYYDLSKLLF